LNSFDVGSINETNDPRIAVQGQAIDTALVHIFGSDTIDYERYQWAVHLRSGRMVMAGYGPSIREVRDELEQGRRKAIATLEGIVRRFQEELELDADKTVDPDNTDSMDNREKSRRVFVVHGHDEGMREAVARFLSQLGFAPIILNERPNEGRTVIEKVEAHGDVSFAVVLLSPDDVGCNVGGTPISRARQNVLLELGYFIGRLGRKNVCALKRGDLEIPSDFGGVVYEEYDSGGWKQVLGRELEAAGFEIDWNKVMRGED